MVLQESSGGWLATDADLAVTSDVELIDGVGPARPAAEETGRTGPLSAFAPSAPGGVIVQTLIVLGAAIGAGILVFFTVKAAVTPDSDDQVQVVDDLPTIGLDPDGQNGDRASVAVDSNRSGSKRNSLEDGVPEDAPADDEVATEEDTPPPPAIASTAEGETADQNSAAVSVEDALTDALTSGINAGLAATGNRDALDESEQTDLTLAASGPDRLEGQPPGVSTPLPFPAPAGPIVTAPVFAPLSPSTTLTTIRPASSTSRPPVTPQPGPVTTDQPVATTEATSPPTQATTTTTAPTTSTTLAPVTSTPTTTATTEPQPTTTPSVTVPTTTATLPTTTTTTEPTASTVGVVPLISSPFDGSVHTWETDIRFEAASVSGAVEYCWQLVSSGRTFEGCEADTGFTVPGGVDGINPGLVRVTAEAKGPADEVLRSESIDLTVLARDVVRSPENGDEFEPNTSIEATFVELPAATGYCVILSQGEIDLPEVCSPDPAVTADPDGFSNGPVRLSTEVFRGAQVIGRQSVRLAFVNGPGPSEKTP